MAKKKPYVPPGCHCGKTWFSSRNKVVASILRRIKAGAPALMVYRCPSGHGFHMSSSVGNIQGRKIS